MLQRYYALFFNDFCATFQRIFPGDSAKNISTGGKVESRKSKVESRKSFRQVKVAKVEMPVKVVISPVERFFDFKA